MTTPPTAPTRGWYRDPESPTKWRFWDGLGWHDGTIDFPARFAAREIVSLGREVTKTQWIYVPVAILFLAFTAMDVARLPLIPQGSVLGEIVLLGYPVWHLFLARSALTVAGIYRIPVRPLTLWVPVIGPLLWWHIIGRVQSAPLWARLAPIWCAIGAFEASVHEPVQQFVVGLTWTVGIVGSVVVVSGFRRTIAADTQPPVVP